LAWARGLGYCELERGEINKKNGKQVNATENVVRLLGVLGRFNWNMHNAVGFLFYKKDHILF